jgi:radical SAM superfamily enzyme YgiQ (UPF0313 family)
LAKITLVKAGVLSPDHPLITQPLGIMYLAAAVRRAGHEVKLIDAKATGLDDASAARQALAGNPDVVGISGFSNEWDSFEGIGRQVKNLSPGTVLVGGGPHATSYPEEIFERSPFDYLALGEGENTLLELLALVDKGESAAKVAGLACQVNGEIHFTEEREKIADLDTLPLPAYDLIDTEIYAEFISASPIGRRRYMSVFTSRGCPYRCIYCHNLFGKQFRTKSADRVLEELVLLREKYNIYDIEITDDIFNLDRDRMMEICRMIISEKLGLRLSFPNGLRGDRMDAEMIAMLKKAGTVMISYAVETASPRLQKLIRKNNKLEKIFANINETVRQGIFTNGFFMIGFPTETEEEARLTADYAVASKLHSASFFIVTPFKGTSMWDMVPPEDRKKATVKWFSFHGGYVNLSKMDTKTLYAIRREAYRRFYLSPHRMVRTFWRHPDKTIFFNAVKILSRQFMARSIEK